ncbi:response regulator [Chitinophaga sp. SYP-B3965]|uniref:LytR/AlgR family response regulator transcription factor n=1 Tax=Chitinophaga sp. SYP-B3965 TaxID=2663120 RepID=UPI0012996EF8|nr:LytTR family DNA-binding domain-containing protein [Chitinophaga sp. SYP-B3965]MRG44572.1 response regulator [Chitinophaga sp. SYP-B3965]
MQVLILEDEPLVAAHLLRLVKQLQPDWQLMGPLASLREATQWLTQQPQPDLILADIQLSDGISLDLFNHLQPACPVIFTTAYDHYAIRAFKINSIDYLLKPVDVEELENAFKKFALLREKYSNPVYLQELMQFVQHQQRKQAFKESFTVHYGRSVYVVPVGEIVCFTKQELIYLHQADGRQWITDCRSLDEVEELLDPQQFYRANRQCIVQKRFLTGYRSDDTGKLNVQLKMEKPPQVMVSKDKAAAFKEWITP